MAMWKIDSMRSKNLGKYHQYKNPSLSNDDKEGNILIQLFTQYYFKHFV